MNKLFSLLLLVLVTSQYAQTSVYDVVEDAKIELSNLRALVFGHIQVAQDNFAHYYSDIASYSHNIVSLGELSIDQVYAEVAAELTQIKDLALAAGKDISYCTGGREQMIHRLPDELKGRLETCIAAQTDEAKSVLDSSIYLVDTVMTRVQSLEFQLDRCANEPSCVSVLLTQIEKDTTDLPLQIQLQINKAKEMLDELKVIVKECNDNNVADFTAYVTDLVAQIADCANKILG
ncbi:hypothetical protein Zmor_004984 [Zophobas morio]|uniref:Protein TsetseEP domain-containing protein n=1 Tax=Zophobas morio TaxID=2755281 RepID=A0AA38ISB7_9CUCU|nr:hypothetical protein Zmor_004984 [Zophobas morio]